MSIVSVPYTFTNGLPLDATQINANFQALAGGLGSGLANAALTNITATSLTLGTISYADTGIVYGAQGSLNGYVQDVVQNTNAGSTASADYVVSNNLGTVNAYYGDFGINSSTFSGTGSLSLPNATYLYSANGDLVLGTYTANAIHIVVGNGATDAMQISAAGVVSFATPLAVSNGGTGVSSVPVNGQLLIGNGTGYSLATLTAGTGVNITNNAGSITISAAGPATGAVGQYTATGGETTITMAFSVPASWAIELFRNGVRQIPGVDYSVSTNTITLVSAAALAGDSFWWLDSGTTIVSSGPVVFPAYAVGSLPAAASNTYARAFVTDSNAAYASASVGNVVSAGGSNKVPVYSDGTNWRIG